MSAINREAFLGFVWRPENDGQGYHVDPGDLGGGTSYGVTETTWSDAQRARVAPSGVALAHADHWQLATVLYWCAWDAVRADELPTGVDLCVANMAMVAGAERARMILQTALGVTVDGIVGPKTLGAAQTADPVGLVDRLTSDDEAFYGSLGGLSKEFGRGWTRRAEDAKNASLALIANA